MKVIKYDAEYASEVMNSIPLGYIDKTVCGVGLSSVALENEENTIIAVPSVELIKNKIVQYPNSRSSKIVLGVYGGIDSDTIKNYVQDTKSPLKIMVTYDSLYKVEHLIDKYNCKLVIDESNKLLSSSTLKSTSKKEGIDVITKVFNIAQKYKDRTSFVSATPTPLEYLPKWISKIPHTKLEWSNTIKATPLLMKRQFPTKSLITEIILPLEEYNQVTVGTSTFSKVIVFINSIKNILRVCKECKLKVDDVGVIAGSSIKNDVALKKYNRLKSPTNLPKYTFVTSSGFEGIDLVDDEAMSVVVSSTTKSYQMIDIMTDLKQAISRQRSKSNPNYASYVYIYNQSIFEKSEEELLELLQYNYEKIQELIIMWKDAVDRNMNKGGKALETIEDFKIYTNYDEVNNTRTMNTNLFNADKYFILITRNQYTNGFDIKGNFENSTEIDIPDNIIKLITYRDMVDIYNKSKDLKDLEPYKYKDDYYRVIVASIKLYGKVWNHYTYAKKMIKNYTSEPKQLSLTIKQTFKKDHFYTAKEIKNILNKIYKDFEVSKTAKAVDLQEFVKLKPVTNGIRGFIVL